jgi:hypothetical protein
LKARDSDLCALINVGCQSLPKFGCTGRWVAEPTMRPSGKYFG